LYGEEWDAFDKVMFDEEEKITEFNYEQFIPAPILKEMDTESEDFKRMIKLANLKSKTKFEQHKENQENFKHLMLITSRLNQEETETFLHLLKNKRQSLNSA
jgi:hypothetical protein